MMKGGAMTESDGTRVEQLRELRARHARHGATADIAYWTIRDAIRTGVIQAGERLVELDLAAALDMSRTPVREALRQLEVERLVEASPRRGFVVPTMTIDDLVEIFEIREVLEGLAARRAAQRMGPAEIAALRETLERMEQARDNDDATALAEASRQFHRLLRSGSRHARLPHLLSLLFDAHRSISLHELAPDRVDGAISEHHAICDAIAAHDAALAEQLAREHSRNALRAQLLAHRLTE